MVLITGSDSQLNTGYVKNVKLQGASLKFYKILIEIAPLFHPM